jgi:hypothetical protein
MRSVPRFRPNICPIFEAESDFVIAPVIENRTPDVPVRRIVNMTDLGNLEIRRTWLSGTPGLKSFPQPLKFDCLRDVFRAFGQLAVAIRLESSDKSD